MAGMQDFFANGIGVLCCNGSDLRCHIGCLKHFSNCVDAQSIEGVKSYLNQILKRMNQTAKRSNYFFEILSEISFNAE